MKRTLSTLFATALTLGVGAASAAVPANPFDYTRTTGFTYNADGTLATTTMEPSQLDMCSVKTYTYDRGNAATVQVSNCAGATGRAAFTTRTVSSAGYQAVASQSISVGGALTPVAIAAGVAQTSLANALGQGESYLVDPRFNAKLQTTGPNGLVTSTTVDDWGRAVRVKSPDNTSLVQAYCVLTVSGTLDTSQPSNSPNCPTTFATGEVPPGARMVSHVEPRDTNDAKMGSFTRTYTDILGRTIRKVTESFDGVSQTAGRAGVPVAVDTVYDTYGNKVLETQPYYLVSGSSATTGSNDVGASLFQYDFLGRVNNTYVSSTSDASSTVSFGSGSGSIGYGAYGSQKASKSAATFVGLTTTTVNDKGVARIEEKAANGVVIRVTDALGAQVAYLGDAFGNMVATKDALGNTITTQYDFMGNKVNVFDPDKGVTSYCYDALGQLKASQTSTQRGNLTPVACPNNNDSLLTATLVPGWTTLAYDKAGRMTQRVEPEFTTTNYYDAYADASACTKGVGRLCETITQNGVDKRYAYDALGRVIGERVDIASSGKTFAQGTAYDLVTGRKASQTYPTGLQVAYAYTPKGYVQNLALKTTATSPLTSLPNTQGQTAPPTSLATNAVLWQADVVNARGDLEKSTYGNGVVDTRTYAAGTGRALTVVAGLPANPGNVFNHAYTWDSVNNLTARVDANGDGGSGSVSETFGFDSLNRLSQYTVQGTQLPGYARSVILNYNALGMVLSKTDVGNYSYAAQGGVQPHAPRSVSNNGGTNYGYDLNGNLTSATSGPYASLSYTSFDMVATAANAASTIQYSWMYDADHSRIKEVRTSGGNTRTTWYMNPDAAGALGFEAEVDTTPALQSNRHYLTAYGAPVGVLVSTGALPSLGATQLVPTGAASLAFNKVEYWERDHLGSLAATTDHLGTVTARYSYDPFGKRRFANGVYDAAGTLVVDWNPTLNSGDGRGFTGHEQLDDIGLVNMNGRLYDSTNGLFVQADPHVTDPQNLQNFNRYSYVLNNPLNATDPSGFDDCFFCTSGGYDFGGGSSSYWSTQAPTYYSNYNYSSSYSSYSNYTSGTNYFSSSFGSFGSSSSYSFSNPVSFTFSLPATTALNSGGFSSPSFQPLLDGFADVGRTTTMQTNTGDWILGRSVGIATEGTLQLAATTVDFFRAWTNAGLNMVGLSQYTTNYTSAYGLALQNGNMSLGSALYNFGTAPAQGIIQTAQDLLHGNWQDASANGLAMFFSPRFAKGEDMFTQAGGVYNWKSPKGTVEGPFSLWAPSADTPITFYHGSPQASFLDRTGFVSDYLSACERGCVSTSTNFSHSRTGLSSNDAGVFQYNIPFGEVKAGQMNGTIINIMDGPGPETVFKGQAGMDLLNKYKKK